MRLSTCFLLELASMGTILLGGGNLFVLLNTTPLPVSLDRNRNRIPDECEGASRLFHRGDANDDGKLNIADAVFVLSYLFRGGAAPAPPGPPPQACGADPDSSVHLSCDSFTSC